jgi:hypothetical protein
MHRSWFRSFSSALGLWQKRVAPVASVLARFLDLPGHASDRHSQRFHIMISCMLESSYGLAPKCWCRCLGCHQANCRAPDLKAPSRRRISGRAFRLWHLTPIKNHFLSACSLHHSWRVLPGSVVLVRARSLEFPAHVACPLSELLWPSAGLARPWLVSGVDTEARVRSRAGKCARLVGHAPHIVIRTHSRPRRPNRNVTPAQIYQLSCKL